MTQFSQHLRSDDRIRTTPEDVWAVLSDPAQLARMTPLVEHITVDGDRWRWRLVRINGVGMTRAPEFTTVMAVEEGRRIDFAPAPDRTDRARATGHIAVEPDGEDTVVAIDITATVDVPLPKAMGGAVRRVMYRTLKAGGSRFARNLLRHLGNPPHRGLDVTRVG